MTESIFLRMGTGCVVFAVGFRAFDNVGYGVVCSLSFPYGGIAFKTLRHRSPERTPPVWWIINIGCGINIYGKFTGKLDFSINIEKQYYGFSDNFLIKNHIILFGEVLNNLRQCVAMQADLRVFLMDSVLSVGHLRKIFVIIIDNVSSFFDASMFHGG